MGADGVIGSHLVESARTRPQGVRAMAFPHRPQPTVGSPGIIRRRLGTELTASVRNKG
jgi:hypothetical protein